MTTAATGGGGLISLPAYLFAGLPPHYTYATNKFSAACGTTFATANFFKNGAMNLKVGILAAIGSFAGSALGAPNCPSAGPELLMVAMERPRAEGISAPLQLVGHACHDKNGRRPVHAYGPA